MEMRVQRGTVPRYEGEEASLARQNDEVYGTCVVVIRAHDCAALVCRFRKARGGDAPAMKDVGRGSCTEAADWGPDRIG